MAVYNNLDIKKWKDYSDIFTDSLWLINKRDNKGAHKSKYHGNFVPQIPRQLLLRYTKKGDWVIDPFMGSGTTIIEAQKLERNSIGIEIQKEILEEAQSRIDSECIEGIETVLINGDAKKESLDQVIESKKISKVQFIIFHPPYWDIIKFSDNKEDLSNSESLDNFKKNFSLVIDNTTKHLENGRYCALVIGDKYSNKQITPLSFICMNLFLERKFQLKAIIVKNIGDTEGKYKQQSLWRYRALSSDFYVFKHEYIMVFKKLKK